MAELDDVATWLNIIIPITLPIGAAAYAYARKTSMAVTDIKQLQEQMKNLKKGLKILLEDKFGKDGVRIKELLEDDKTE